MAAMPDATPAHRANDTDPRLRSVLSPREAEVLQLATLGLTNPQIAAHLQVTVHAVKFHLARVYRKLGVANRTEAVVRSLRDATPLDDAAKASS
jgi:DNA-binding NarL/FixJ family response regulator